MRLSTYISLKLGRVKIFRQNKNWLAYRTLSILKTRHPEIFKTSLKDKINYYINILSKGDKWWIIVLGILLFFCFGLINIPPLNILKIAPETAYDLVLQRTANMAMIISITLVVVGYILNTLSDKSTLVFNLLLEKTRLYPIVYLNLTLIGVFFIISSLRDTIPSDIFTRLTLSGTYLAVFLLFLFGWLFAKVFFYSKKENILKMWLDELLTQGLYTLRKDILKRESSKIFQDIVEKEGGSVIDSVKFIKTVYPSFKWGQGDFIKEYEVVKDIHLKLIFENIDKKDLLGNNKFNQIGIGYLFGNDSRHLNPNISIVSNELPLNKKFILSSSLKIEDNKEDIKVFLNNRLIELCEKRNYREIEFLDVYYIKLFELQFTYDKDGSGLIEGIKGTMREAFKIINKNKDEDSFLVMRSLVVKILGLSIEYKSEEIFKDFAFIFPMMYHLSFDDKDDDKVSFKFYERCAKAVSSTLKNIIDLYISLKFTNANDDLKELRLKNKFIYHVYENFAQLLFYITGRGDEIQFRYAVNEFNQLGRYAINDSVNNEGIHLRESLDSKSQMIESEKRKPFSYHRRVLLYIRYWTVFLFRQKKIGEKTFRLFFDETNVYFPFGESVATDVIFLKNQSHYLGMSDWDYVERHSRIGYIPVGHAYWLVFGLFVDMVIKSKSFGISRIPIANITVIENLYSVFQQAHIEIRQKFDYWKEALGVRDIDEYQNRVNKLFEVIDKRVKVEGRKEREKIVRAELDAEKIENYKKIIGKAWDENARIRRLFDYFDASKEVLSKQIELLRIGRPEFLGIIKENLIKEGVPLFGLESWGSELAEWENNSFFSEVFKYSNSGIKEIKRIELIKTLDASISGFKKKSKSPNFIFLSDRYKYNNTLLENSNFVGEQKISQKEKKETYPVNFIGNYDGIPVFSFRMIGHANSLIVGNFQEAFAMLYRKIEGGYKNLLKVAFREVNNEKAQEIFDGKPEAWKSYYSQTLSEEEALLLIRTSLYIDIHTILKFEIKNNEAIIIGTFKN